jgi:hypothetical protein
MDRLPILNWLVVHEVSDWFRGAAANFWLDARNEEGGATTPVGLGALMPASANATNYEAATEGAHEWIEMNQSLPAVSICRRFGGMIENTATAGS